VEVCRPVSGRSEVLTGILVNLKVFWDTMMCHRASSSARLLDCEDERHYEPSKHQELLAQQHSIASHKT
jgi:hypothetical protein